MTTWSTASAAGYTNLAMGAYNAVTDGVLLYGMSQFAHPGPWYIRKYDPSTNISTDICSESWVNNNGQGWLTCFGDRVYYMDTSEVSWAGPPNYDPVIRIRRWDGGGSWPIVAEFGYDDFKALGVYFDYGPEEGWYGPYICSTPAWAHTKNTLTVAVSMMDNLGCGTTDTEHNALFSTSNGTSWTGTLLDTSGVGIGVDIPDLGLGGHIGVGRAFRYDNNDFYVNGVQVTDTTDYDGADKNYFWKDNYKHSTDGNTWVSCSDTTLTWLKNNTVFPVAWWEDTAPSPNKLYLAYWSLADFNATREFVVNATPAASISGLNIIRLDTGLTFLGAHDSGIGWTDWYVRDDNLGAGDYPDEEIYDPGQYYAGTDTEGVQYKSDSPIPSIPIGGIKLFGSKVMIASALPNPIMVAYTDNDVAWVDWTGSVAQAGAAKAIDSTRYHDEDSASGGDKEEGGFNSDGDKCT